MKIGVSSYSFIRLVENGEMEEIEVVAKAAEMGFDAIEFIPPAVPGGETLESFARRLKEECERVGIEPVNYAVAADFLTGSGGDLEAEIEQVKAQVRVAHALGVPRMRHDATAGFPPGREGPSGFDDALPVLADACRRITGYAAELGIQTMVENHGYFCQDSERLEKLVKAVDRPNFGALVDIGNFACTDEDCPSAVARLMPCAFHVHAKDFHYRPGGAPQPGDGWFPTRGGNYLRGAVLGRGEVPVLQCLEAVKEAGYDGVLSIEYEGLEDVLTAIETSHENLKSYISEIYG